MFGDLKSGPRWNNEVPHALEGQFHLQNTHKKIWLFETKLLNLDVGWFEIQGPVELWGPPRIGGPIPPSKPQIQNTHEIFWLFESKLLNLDVWWFEIGAPVEFWGSPRVGGPIPPSKPQIQNTHKKIWFFETKY
jgi:hypothetical protein